MECAVQNGNQTKNIKKIKRKPDRIFHRTRSLASEDVAMI
jgi:hypothetical protein